MYFLWTGIAGWSAQYKVPLNTKSLFLYETRQNYNSTKYKQLTMQDLFCLSH